tara:strand:+ start:135 stop:1292 length:1158 start_codon:yes stop_codon:yes gene_type:complete
LARKAIYKHATQVNTSSYPDDGTSPVGSNEWNEDPAPQGMIGNTPTTSTITIASGVATVTDSITVVTSESSTSDTLDKLAVTNTNEYDLIYLFANTGHTITLTHTSSPSADGHVFTVSGANETLSTTIPTILIRKGTYWYGYGGGGASTPTTITVADSTDTTCFPALFESATGDLAPKTDAGITYNAGTGALTATSFAGALTGNVTGNASGTAATVTGGTQASITTCANLVETGALNAGTITSGFGNIDNGSSTLDTGAVDCAAITTSGTLNMSDNIITGIHSLDTDIDTVAYGASVALDFDDNEEIILGELTGAITFTTSNRALGKHKTIHIDCDGTDRAFTFPSWVWIGAVPTTATANKRSVLSLTCLGTADTDIRAVFTSEA